MLNFSIGLECGRIRRYELLISFYSARTTSCMSNVHAMIWYCTYLRMLRLKIKTMVDIILFLADQFLFLLAKIFFTQIEKEKEST